MNSTDRAPNQLDGAGPSQLVPGRVSVVIPTFNRARFLPDAIRSVLEQGYRNLELIVVDDGSTDETPEILDGFEDERLTMIRISRSHSPARARNVGIASASGQFLAFLDSDDIWLSAKLEWQVAALTASSECRWSYTLFDHIDEGGAPMAPLRGGVGRPRSGWILERIITEDALVLLPSVVAEASLVREVGGFDETPELREDLDLCFRLAARSQAWAVDERLLRVRHHSGRTTYELPEVRDWRVRALRKLARSAPPVRRLCRRECAREMVDLARAYQALGRPRSALIALGRALRYGPLRPDLWTTLAKVLLRPLATRRMLEAYRRLRDRRSSDAQASDRATRVSAQGDAPAELRLDVSVLGVPVTVETNSPWVLELAKEAHGDGASPGNASRARLRVRIIEDADLPGEAAVTPVVRLPEHDRLVLEIGGGHAYADAALGTAAARVSPATVAAPGFREGVLDHLALFLVTHTDRCPLHAGAIAQDGMALLIAGPSGLGKSSLTYAAMRAGFQVLADDVVYVQRDPRLRLWSMPRRIHLSPNATRHFPELAGSQESLRPDGRSKISVPISPSARVPVPWVGDVALCLLSSSSEDRPVERLSPEAAVVEMRATLQGGFLRFADSLDECVLLAARGGCWRLTVTVPPSELVLRLEGMFSDRAASS